MSREGKAFKLLAHVNLWFLRHAYGQGEPDVRIPNESDVPVVAVPEKSRVKEQALSSVLVMHLYLVVQLLVAIRIVLGTLVIFDLLMSEPIVDDHLSATRARMSFNLQSVVNNLVDFDCVEVLLFSNQRDLTLNHTAPLLCEFLVLFHLIVV